MFKNKTMKCFDNGKPKWYLILLGIFLSLSIDQISKYIASQVIKEEVLFGSSGFGLKYQTNEKLLAFHLIKVSNPGVLINSFVNLVILLCVYLIYRFLMLHFAQRKLFTWAFIFCFGGLIGNFVDFIFLGYARDFIVFWKLGICNFGDIFYYVGLALFFVSIIGNSKTRKKLNRATGKDIKTFLRFCKSEIKRLIITPFSILQKLKH
jgi:lipoprotein signal peptidase